MAELTKIETKIPENLTLGGVHHVTAITSSAQKIYYFFTNILGLRLAKLTVNQDDYETYHLFFTEEDGHGADMTFFDFKDIPAIKNVAIPYEISNVHFNCDLSNISTIEDEILKSSKSLLFKSV